jgi:hypothetical protein
VPRSLSGLARRGNHPSRRTLRDGSLGDPFPGTSCQATIVKFLRDAAPALKDIQTANAFLASWHHSSGLSGDKMHHSHLRHSQGTRLWLAWGPREPPRSAQPARINTASSRRSQKWVPGQHLFGVGPGATRPRARSLHIRHQTSFSRSLSGEYLEGVFEADKVELHKVIRSPVHKVVAGLAEYPDVGGKSVFESPADDAKHAIGSDIVA